MLMTYFRLPVLSDQRSYECQLYVQTNRIRKYWNTTSGNGMEYGCGANGKGDP